MEIATYVCEEAPSQKDVAEFYLPRNFMARQSTQKLQYSVLEGRRLLAVSASLSGDTLSIFGDNAANSITVFTSGDQLNVTGDFEGEYSLNDVSEIRFFGGGGDDFFDNNTNIDTLASGQDGNDDLRGGGGNDRIFGGEGNDTLIGNGGDDRLVGNDGADDLFGGDGADVLFGQNGSDLLEGNAGNDRLVGGSGDDDIDGGDGDDLVFGGFGDDLISGGDGNDSLFGQDDNDVVSGNAGNDTVRGNTGDDELRGDVGDDRLLGDEGVDMIFGDDGRDIVYGGAGDDFIFGGQGNDLLFANAGDDEIYGEAGNDVLRGNEGNDRLFGGANADRLVGDDGDDFLDGGLASDRVLGDAGSDTIVGEFSDRITGGADDDFIELADGGNDTLFYSQDFSDYVVTETGGNLVINDETGTDGLDIVSGADRLIFADGSRAAAANFTQRVYIQPIVVSDNNGSNTATFFGNDEQSFEIERAIDEIYLQAGIDVEFLSATTVDSTFFNEGNGSSTRNSSDLNEIVDQGDRIGVGSSDPLVIDLYFVNQVPGFATTSANTANGLAFVGGSGVAIHVGENLLSFESGRDVISRVAAHEIGHNLGLNHSQQSNNLLTPGSSGANLNGSQVSTVRGSNLSQGYWPSEFIDRVERSG